ncbi:uncharacterized protein K460DRAFT_415794 [Cucurbitaria berberidis CBS 394.84]|uniref:Uncharacterized protein n=1 Tax=Cucurbitaria berberidis CBS 394.84 TaxID=1168544 RepID=A0A9P4GPY6_9PLEO|nr:uncharacterized protein K460DRAFT_415794 [Cucurbitaria berberidis CBS 394.84]KAF1849419.1 hypothetical protein K460DRAFT_415794 [Cucurbitaria berberidis CBS 394.84]
MEYGSSYTPPLHNQHAPNHQRVESTDDDTVGMLSQAAPSYQYEAYRPPDQQFKSIDTSVTNRMYADISPLSARISTPPGFQPVPTSSSIGQATINYLPTTRTQQSPPASPGFRSRLFGSRNVPYQENVAWANSTQFRPTTVEVPDREYEAQIVDAGMAAAPSKQYFREARHVREPWSPGIWTRFPRKGLGALVLIVLLTAGSSTILFLSDGTRPENWKVGMDSVQPHVYVSIFEMIIILLNFCALAEGIVITFWHRLLQSTNLVDVHDMHDLSFLWPAIKRTSRLQFNAVATASILTAFSLSRGPFFQRAIILIDGRYQTNTTFVMLGIVVSLASVIAILPLYYGYWDFGRKVSLNPLEIARAFGAPLLDGLDGNLTSTGVEMERGAVTVKYGACERYGGEKVLRVEDAARVNIRAPWQGEIFG